MFNITLNNGLKMPVLGYGTYKITGDIDVKQCILDALKIGYRKIDTAIMYNNGQGIGEGIAESGILRKDLFVTSKLWTNVNSYDKTLFEVDNLLKSMKMDYLDLLLIHWPIPENFEVWRAMEKLYNEGIVKAIGTSNFKEHHIIDIMDNFDIKPVVNQVELHPWFQQPELQEFCKKNGIQLEAWSPLMRGKVFEINELKKIAEKYGKSISQVVIRYDIQSGITVIPKSIKPDRMKENFNVFDFELSAEDMAIIKALNKNERQYRDPDCHGY